MMIKMMKFRILYKLTGKLVLNITKYIQYCTKIFLTKQRS